MRVEDVIPFLAMIAYIALLVFKRRKQSGGDAQKRAARKSPRDRTRYKTQEEKPRAFFNDSSKGRGRGVPGGEVSPRATGLFSKLGERLKVFLSELEQQFRMEAEKARMKGQVKDRESDKSHAAEQGVFADFDLVDFESSDFIPQEDMEEVLPIKTPEIPAVARGKKETPARRVIKKPVNSPCPGVNLSLSPDEIRTAVVWSEILASPLALRTGKRPWEN